MSWKALGDVAPTHLVDARLELHHAVQLVASAGTTFLSPEPDDSHPNMAWVSSMGALMGRPLPKPGVQVGLRIADLSILLIDHDGQTVDELELRSRTVDEGYSWLAKSMRLDGETLPNAEIVRASYELPHHGTSDGASFSGADTKALIELAKWFANAQYFLEGVVAKIPSASEVRCWPHHFDVGALIIIKEGSDESVAKSIGIGLSPGDDNYHEPYWYVSPWPHPDSGPLPSLEKGGHWHTEGFTSAILTGSELINGGSAQQVDRLKSFFDSAIDVSRQILAV